jgi:small basic protein
MVFAPEVPDAMKNLLPCASFAAMDMRCLLYWLVCLRSSPDR